MMEWFDYAFGAIIALAVIVQIPTFARFLRDHGRQLCKEIGEVFSMPFRFLRRKTISVDEAVKTLLISLVDAEDCWRDVCMLRDYKVPGVVATCEMAFARTAIVKYTIRRCQPEVISKAMVAAIDRSVIEGFSGQDTELTLQHYANERLSEVGPRAVKYYEDNMLPFTGLALHFAARLSVPGAGAPIEIAPLFERVAAEAERMTKSMRISAPPARHSR